MRKFSALFMLSGAVGALNAQTATDLNEGSRLIVTTTPDNYIFSWWGKDNRSYVIEHSLDLRNPWDYIPSIEPGYDEIAQWGFATNSDKFFLRLKYTDDPLTGAFYSDDDGDGIINGVEMLLGYSATTANGNSDGDLLTDRQEIALGLDPEDATDAVDADNDGIVDAIERLYGLSTTGTTDLDGDTMDDEWELTYYLDLTINDAALDPDNDGLTNLEEFNEGTNPWAFDTDGDTIPDGLEVANMPDLAPKVPEPIHVRNNYAWQFTTDLTDRFSEFSDRISESSTHALALDKNGEVYAWGGNDFGQLGLGAGTAGTGDVSSPDLTQFSNSRSVSVGYGTSHVVTSNGGAQAAGDNAAGLLGIGSAPTVKPSPVDIPSAVAGFIGKEIFRISGRHTHPTGFLGHREAIAGSNKSIFAWGMLASSNYPGATFTGTAEGPMKALSSIVSLSSGHTHGERGPTIAVDQSGSVYLWGTDFGYGGLLHSDWRFQTTETTVHEITAVQPASYANAKYGYGASASVDGQIFVWGLFRGRSGIDYVTTNNQQYIPLALTGTLGSRGVAITLMTEDVNGTSVFATEKSGFYLDSSGGLFNIFWRTSRIEQDTSNQTFEEIGETHVVQVFSNQSYVAIAEGYEGVFLLSSNGEVFKYTPDLISYTIPQYSANGQLLHTYTATAPSGTGEFTKIEIPNFYDLVDSNSDGLSDLYARFIGLNPNSLDTNLDGVNDFESISAGTDPLSWDNDGDSIPNGVELAKGLNPNSTDSDGDGMLDNEEFYLYERRSNYVLPSTADGQGPTINLVSPSNAIAL